MKDRRSCERGNIIRFRRFPIVVLMTLLIGCAVRPPVSKGPEAETYPPPKPPIYQEVPVEKDPFQGVVQKYRWKALDLEKNGELTKAILCWRVVGRLAPKDREVSERIEILEAQIRTGAEKHFQKGLEAFHRNSIEEARKEFLLTLTYNSHHGKALDYLKYKLHDPDSIVYETKGGDTSKKISQEIYGDPEKDFLVAYFNDLDGRDLIKPRVALKLPKIIPERMARRTSSEEMVNQHASLSKSRKPDLRLQDQAEVHYAKGLKYFLSEDLRKAIEEWEETLRLNPDHPKAKRDLEKAHRLLKNLKRLP
ncbi:MAG: tetratricopeptide repeat protein [Thermodesulfobacteriota bacterium]|nr:tetratricopeptide repeat protein [Thermodesulfobacteriota bacterium]